MNNSHRYEHKQDFEQDELCPVCFDPMEEDHQHNEDHKLFSFINFLIIEYLFDYNDSVWLRMDALIREDIIYSFVIFSFEMDELKSDMSRDELAAELLDTGRFNELVNELEHLFGQYPNISNQFVNIRSKIMEMCIALYRFRQ